MGVPESSPDMPDDAPDMPDDAPDTSDDAPDMSDGSPDTSDDAPDMSEKCCGRRAIIYVGIGAGGSVRCGVKEIPKNAKRCN
ncbi:MAG: hypothetical protein LBT48_03790 [Prevotellaceae bacterium]|nr:hypothetical protein [Prevotellaceae bacterium]